MPKEGSVFISVNDSDKIRIISISRDFKELGFNIVATSGTARLLNENGIPANEIFKVGEGRPNIVDAIKNNDIQIQYQDFVFLMVYNSFLLLKNFQFHN